jgi:hypothetical protein
MLPTEQFSGDATEDKTPWTPQVWRDGPDVLVQQAQLALFSDRSDVEVGALGPSTTSASMDGQVTQPANESDQLINPSAPSDGTGRATQWNNNLKTLRATHPLAGTVKPLDYDPDPGDANPAP